MCYRYMISDDDHAAAVKQVIGYEIIFVVHCGQQFFVDFTSDGSKVPVRDLSKISTYYLNHGFKGDIIPLIPL